MRRHASAPPRTAASPAARASRPEPAQPADRAPAPPREENPDLRADGLAGTLAASVVQRK
jgi:hypothetical protein